MKIIIKDISIINLSLLMCFLFLPSRYEAADVLFEPTKSHHDDLATNNPSTISSSLNPTNIKGNITVNIRLEPFYYLGGKAYISTAENLTATAEISDEKFRNVTLTYQWSIKNQTIKTDTNAFQIVHNFPQPDETQFLDLLVFHPQNDTGSSRKDIVVRDPVKIATPDRNDKLFLEHGELLNITIKFSGTGPYKYCYKICRDNYRPKCELCEPENYINNNQVHLLLYLRYLGNYTMQFTVDNIASRESKFYTVRIMESIRPRSLLPYIPIVASILAVLILLIGLALHMRLKQTLHTETADFDFIQQANRVQDEEFWDEEQSFFQRVRYMLFQADWDGSSASLSDSNLSASRARLV